MTSLKAIGAAALAAGLRWGASAHAQQASAARTPPSWDALVKCAEIGDDEMELACYRAAMRDAGYRPSEAAVAAQKRGFGINSLLRRKKDDTSEDVAEAGPRGAAPAGPESERLDKDRVTAVLAQVAVIPPSNRLLLITTDGTIWEQLDTETVYPLPKKGQSFEIRRNKFGGWLCAFDKRNAVRCERTR